VVSFMCGPLYLHSKNLRYPLDRRLSGPQSCSGHNGEEKKSCYCPCQEFNPGCPACSLVYVLTELPQLCGIFVHFTFSYIIQMLNPEMCLKNEEGLKVLKVTSSASQL
jgi:hypothetical protein